MEKWFTPELGRLMAVLGIGCLSLSFLMGWLIGKIRGSFRAVRKPTIWYMLAAVAFFAVTGLLAAAPIFKSYLNQYIFYQVIFVVLGIIHILTMHRRLAWAGDDKSFWPELLFTVIIALLGSLCFIMVFRAFNREGLQFIMASAACCFIIPFFVYHTFLRSVAIPPKVFKQWLYPVHEEVADPDESKLKNLLVISFEFQKQVTDKYFTNFRAKAPTDMEFGQLFYYFINDYNERHVNSKINYIENSGTPFGWIFYKKPKWYTIFTKYIDWEKTIYNNGIRENDVIICSRAL